MELKEIKDLTIDKIKCVIEKLPHSKTRVPFTYHHNYLREVVNKFNCCSRSEVSQAYKLGLI